jgi:hypothetical protein
LVIYLEVLHINRTRFTARNPPFCIHGTEGKME